MEPVSAKQLLEGALPHFNPDIALGVATSQFQSSEQYLLKIFQEAANTFPPDLKFLGMRRATPAEEVQYILGFKASSKSSPLKVELAENSIYLVFFDFEFRGERIRQGTYLPYLEKGGQLWLRGVKNTIIPVLTAPVFSVSGNTQQIFMKMTSAKIAFNRIPHTVRAVSKTGIRDYQLSVVYGKIHQTNPKTMAHYQEKKDDRVKIFHASVLYLFCSFGVVGSFERYCKFTPTVYMQGIPEDIDTTHQTVFYSTGNKPAHYKAKNYQSHPIAIGIPNEYVEDTMTLGLIAGFFYVADNYTHILPYNKPASELEDITLWRYILGKAVFLVNDRMGVLIKEIDRHMMYVSQMLDVHQRLDLKSDGIEIDNMVDLIAHLIRHYSRIISEEDNGSLFNKRLLVLRNVFEELIKGINYVVFKVNNGRELRSDVVKREISSRLSTERILTLTSKPNICTVIPTPGDNMAFTHTSRFVLQNNISNKKSPKKTATHDPDQHLHGSIVFVGSIFAIKKGECTGRALLNPYGKTTSTGITVLDPQHQKTLNIINSLIRRE